MMLHAMSFLTATFLGLSSPAFAEDCTCQCKVISEDGGSSRWEFGGIVRNRGADAEAHCAAKCGDHFEVDKVTSSSCLDSCRFKISGWWTKTAVVVSPAGRFDCQKDQAGFVCQSGAQRGTLEFVENPQTPGRPLVIFRVPGQLDAECTEDRNLRQ